MAGTDTLEIRQLARQFAESELRPHVEKWDHDAALDPAVLGELAELGFFGMLVPESFGGMEFDLPTYVAALEEIAWGEPGMALLVALSSNAAEHIVRHGSDAQKQAWLERMALGEVIACVARSEEDDSAVRVQRADAGVVLSGTKKWVTNARTAQLVLVHTRDASYLVPADTRGYTVNERARTLGLRAVDIADVTFDDVRLDSDAALSTSDDADGVTGRLGVAAIALGIAQAALDHACGYADTREQFSSKLRNFEGVQFKLADMAMRTEATRALLQKAAQEASLPLAAMAKVFASETAMWVSTQAVQIYGGYGYMRDYPVEKLMRDAKATELMENVNESERVTIARQLYT